MEAQVEMTTTQQRILSKCSIESLSKREIAKKMGHRTVSGGLKKAIAVLLEKKLINYTISDKLKSRFQKYQITEVGKALLERLKK